MGSIMQEIRIGCFAAGKNLLAQYVVTKPASAQAKKDFTISFWSFESVFRSVHTNSAQKTTSARKASAHGKSGTMLSSMKSFKIHMIILLKTRHILAWLDTNYKLFLRQEAIF